MIIILHFCSSLEKFFQAFFHLIASHTLKCMHGAHIAHGGGKRPGNEARRDLERGYLIMSDTVSQGNFQYTMN